MVLRSLLIVATPYPSVSHRLHFDDDGGPISWKSRLQDNISLSTSEAEFVAVSQASQEVVCLCEILRDFGYIQTAATDIFEDNLACIAMSENPVR